MEGNRQRNTEKQAYNMIHHTRRDRDLLYEATMTMNKGSRKDRKHTGDQRHVEIDQQTDTGTYTKDEDFKDYSDEGL